MNNYIVVSLILGFMFVLYRFILYWFKSLDYEFFEDLSPNDGPKGEAYIFRQMNKVPARKFGVPNLILINEDKTVSSEIDVVFVFPSGLYVFESKNRRGKISGDLMRPKEKWTSYDFLTKETAKIYSPVSQNDGHIKTLSNYLNLDNVPVYNIIAYGPNCKMKVKNKSCRPDVYFKRYRQLSRFVLKNEIASFFNRTRLSRKDVRAVGEWLIDTQVENQKFKNIHKDNVKHYFENKRSPLQKDDSFDTNKTKLNYILELLKDGMKVEDVAAVNFVDVQTIINIKSKYLA